MKNAAFSLGDRLAIKFVSITNILGGAFSLLSTITLVPIFGINAAAMGRFVYGAVVSVNFSRLQNAFSTSLSLVPDSKVAVL